MKKLVKESIDSYLEKEEPTLTLTTDGNLGLANTLTAGNTVIEGDLRVKGKLTVEDKPKEGYVNDDSEV